MTRARTVLAALAILTLAGCFLRRAEAPRFYRPASVALDAADDDAAAPADAGIAVRLPTVRSAPFLRERMVWRSSAVEYGLYEQRRWFELPTRYVRRALATALQDTPGVRLGDASAAARLDVEILAFDEVLAQHHAHVVLAVTVRNGTETRLARTFAAEAPITGDDGAAVAEAMGRALDAVVQEVATATARTLASTTAGAKSRASR